MNSIGSLQLCALLLGLLGIGIGLRRHSVSQWDRFTPFNSSSSVCKRGQFQCNDGQCIPAIHECSGQTECRDGSDEGSQCSTTCGPEQFRCKNGECIRKQYVCDEDQDCEDGYDETPEVCSNRTCKDEKLNFNCKDGSACIRKDQVCDTEWNCDDRSDESTEACAEVSPVILNKQSTIEFNQFESAFLVCEVGMRYGVSDIPRFYPTGSWIYKGPISRSGDYVPHYSAQGKTFQGRLDNNISLRKNLNHQLVSSYHLRRLERYDSEGIYECIAKNDAGSASKQFTVTLFKSSENNTEAPAKPQHPPNHTKPRPGHQSKPSRPSHENKPPPPSSVEDNESGASETKYKCVEAGKYPDPDDCSVYHECVRAQSKLRHYRFECGPGTVYCRELRLCGWKEDCSCELDNQDRTKKSTRAVSVRYGLENGPFGRQSKIVTFGFL